MSQQEIFVAGKGARWYPHSLTDSAVDCTLGIALENT